MSEEIELTNHCKTFLGYDDSATLPLSVKWVKSLCSAYLALREENEKLKEKLKELQISHDRAIEPYTE